MKSTRWFVVGLLVLGMGATASVQADTVLYADNFDRAENPVLGTTSTGGFAWTEHEGDPEEFNFYINVSEGNGRLRMQTDGWATGDGVAYVDYDMDDVYQYKVEFDLEIQGTSGNAWHKFDPRRDGDSGLFDHGWIFRSDGANIDVSFFDGSEISVAQDVVPISTGMKVVFDVDIQSATLTIYDSTGTNELMAADTRTISNAAGDSQPDYVGFVESQFAGNAWVDNLVVTEIQLPAEAATIMDISMSAPAPVPFFTDDFQRAESNLLGSTSSGGFSWTEHDGDLEGFNFYINNVASEGSLRMQSDGWATSNGTAYVDFDLDNVEQYTVEFDLKVEGVIGNAWHKFDPRRDGVPSPFDHGWMFRSDGTNVDVSFYNGSEISVAQDIAPILTDMKVHFDVNDNSATLTVFDSTGTTTLMTADTRTLSNPAFDTVPDYVGFTLSPFAGNAWVDNLVVAPVSAGGTSIVKLVVDAPTIPSSRYYPEAATDLASSNWTTVAHSDNGGNAFVITNLDYSTTAGTNEVIYVQPDVDQKFFRIIAE